MAKSIFSRRTESPNVSSNDDISHEDKSRVGVVGGGAAGGRKSPAYDQY
jgi:hypothetical protein